MRDAARLRDQPSWRAFPLFPPKKPFQGIWPIMTLDGNTIEALKWQNDRSPKTEAWGLEYLRARQLFQ